MKLIMRVIGIVIACSLAACGGSGETTSSFAGSSAGSSAAASSMASSAAASSTVASSAAASAGATSSVTTSGTSVVITSPTNSTLINLFSLNSAGQALYSFSSGGASQLKFFNGSTSVDVPLPIGETVTSYYQGCLMADGKAFFADTNFNAFYWDGASTIRIPSLLIGTTTYTRFSIQACNDAGSVLLSPSVSGTYAVWKPGQVAPLELRKTLGTAWDLLNQRGMTATGWVSVAEGALQPASSGFSTTVRNAGFSTVALPTYPRGGGVLKDESMFRVFGTNTDAFKTWLEVVKLGELTVTRVDFPDTQNGYMMSDTYFTSGLVTQGTNQTVLFRSSQSNGSNIFTYQVWTGGTTLTQFKMRNGRSPIVNDVGQIAYIDDDTLPRRLIIAPFATGSKIDGI